MEQTPLRDRGPRSPDSQAPDVLIIGLGNPILGDDGVGWKVAEELVARLDGRSHVEVDCLAVGGLSLMERMLGYRHVILVDAIETGAHSVGVVKSISLGDLRNPVPGHSTSAHDTSLSTALQTAHAMGFPIPERVEIVAIEARRCHDFSQELSPQIAAAVPVAAQNVLELLGR